MSDGPIYGQTPSGGTAPIQTDATGKLLSNITQVLGNPLTIANPLLSEPTIQTACRLGQAFMESTGRVASSGTAGLVPFSVFNPSLAKNILIYSISVYAMANAQILLNTFTSDPGPGWASNLALTPINRKLGGAATAGITCYTSTAAAGVSSGGTVFGSYGLSTGVETELLTNSGAILLPSGSNNGIALYLTVPASSIYYAINVSHIEY